MPTESKSRPFVQYIGSSENHVNNTITYRSADLGEYKALFGYVGQRTVVNPLSITTYHRVVPFLNGTIPHPTLGTPLITMTDLPVQNWQSTTFDPLLAVGDLNIAQLQEYAWKILAKTNPSEPHVSVPNLVAEMREIPLLVKGYGESLIRSAATANLSWRWAIRPLISDLEKLSTFMIVAQQRFNELKKLRDGMKYIRRRCNLGGVTVNGTRTNVSCDGTGALRAYHQSTTTTKLWGSAEWKLAPDSLIPSYNDAQLEQLANQLTIGTTWHANISLAWELLPWSWLVDWFSNVGDLISATNNSAGLTWGRLALMRTTLRRETFDRDPAWPGHPAISLSNWYDCWSEKKQRWPVYPLTPFPLLSLPILDAGKWSILLSLAALRRRPG